ncbi:ABC transporter substrate-binding protein [Luteococcus sp. H138]|uniref:ABC transporter substrate-binding protein n=1 Tax=unclassified Luteococcus TaxID=2639923 RepID=UPI00313B3403
MSTGKWRKAAALAASLAVMVTGCSSGDKAADSKTAPSSDPNEKVTLTVATFNEFGYDKLYAEYMKLHPNVTVKAKKAATTQEARDNMNTRLAAGSGLADIEAVEVDWLPELMQSSDKFMDLKSDDVAGRWLDWKEKAATDPDGKVIGYGTDIGPEAVCYRSDLFAKAGLPTDREEVAKLLEGDWNKYFAVGKQFVTKVPNVGWYDSPNAIWAARLNQMENPYSSTTEEETVIPLDENKPVKELYDDVVTQSVDNKLSAGLSQWSPDWNKGFQSGKFATMLCPGWMLGVIEGNAAGVKGWDIANVFPGGGGNWGGSYLTVPEQGKNKAAARELAAWLTAPEQQVKAFEAKGTFPSQKEALESDPVKGNVNKFFNNAPVGKILADRAAAVKVTPYKGPNYFAIDTIAQDALTRTAVEKSASREDSWKKAVDEAKALG